MSGVSLSLGILAGVFAALAWGLGDFIVKLAVGREGYARSVFWVQVFGMAAVLPALLFFPVGVTGGAFSIFLILFLGILDVAGTYSFFRGVQIGKLSIVAPIGGSGAVVSVLLSFLFLGEVLSSWQAGGVALVIAGIILVSVNFRELGKHSGKPLSAGVPHALFTLLTWGAMWFFIAFAQAGATWFAAIIGLRIASLASAGAYSGVKRLDLKVKSSSLRLLAAMGLLDTLAFLALSYGYTAELASIVGPIASAYPAITVLLAIALLRERPSASQLIGIAAAIGGVVALSL